MRGVSTIVVVGLLAGAGPAGAQTPEVPVIGLPCEGCESVFVGMPDSIPWSTRLAPEDEPGEPMVVRGTVYDPAGEPTPGVIIYAYHTDATGEYPPDGRYEGWARRHGRLRGWAMTDSAGRYRFETIRPASYPSRTAAAHIHLHVIEPGCCTYYIDSIMFEDDPLLDAEQRGYADGRGGPAIVEPRREDGIWRVERDVHLGRNVPGYRERSAGPPVGPAPLPR